MRKKGLKMLAPAQQAKLVDVAKAEGPASPARPSESPRDGASKSPKKSPLPKRSLQKIGGQVGKLAIMLAGSAEEESEQARPLKSNASDDDEAEQRGTNFLDFLVARSSPPPRPRPLRPLDVLLPPSRPPRLRPPRTHHHDMRTPYPPASRPRPSLFSLPQLPAPPPAEPAPAAAPQLDGLENKKGPLAETLMREQSTTYAAHSTWVQQPGELEKALASQPSAGEAMYPLEEGSEDRRLSSASDLGAAAGIGVDVEPPAPADAPFPRNRHIFALGGFHGEILSTVEVLDLQTGAWVEHAPMGSVRNFPAGACCVLDSGDPLLYVCGGFDGRALSTTAECYDPSHGGWIDVADMGKGRYGHSMVVLDGLIYAIGGSDGDTRLVECYDPSADAWTPVAPMLTPRRFTAAAAVDGKIYVVGGRDATRKDLASVECYDPQTDAWTAVAPMGTPRKQHGVAVLGGKLYAVGGHMDAGGDLASVEVYFPATNTWSTVPPMGSVRKQHGVAAIGGKLYAVGGDAVEGFTSTEAFDPLKNRWEPVAPMGTPRYGHAVVGL